MLTPGGWFGCSHRLRRAMIAFERLSEHARETVWRGAPYIERQDLAEEVIQEAYVKIGTAPDSSTGIASPITWMVSIARNRAIDVVHKRSETSIEEEPAAMEVASDTPSHWHAVR